MLEYADKTYEYKIKLANVEPTNKVLDQIERALAPFEIASISAPKHQILSKNQIDFAGLGACDIYVLTVQLKYPCTDAQIRQAICQQTPISLSQIIAIPAAREEAEDESSSDDAADVDTQPLVGTKRLEALKALASRQYEFAAENKEKLVTTNDLPTGKISPIGSKDTQRKNFRGVK